MRKTKSPPKQKERPVIFKAEMVRAILEDRKTQVRRVIKPQPHRSPGSLSLRGKLRWKEFGWFEGGSMPDIASACPYGVAGDRLWVRETWFDIRAWERATGLRSGVKENVQYRADFNLPIESKVKWKPSIHMPRWASRITLEITGVRVERLQDISEEDCAAEGIVEIQRGLMTHGRMNGYGLAGHPQTTLRQRDETLTQGFGTRSTE